MKKMKQKSMMLTMLVVLAMGMMSAALTACGSDDDDNNGNSASYDGKALSVKDVEYKPHYLEKDNNYDLHVNFTDGTYISILLSGDKWNGKVVDLSQKETNISGWCWFFSYHTSLGDPIRATGEPDKPTQCDTGSTLYVKCLNKSTGEFEIKFKAKQGGPTVEGYFKGKAKPIST